MLLCSRNCTPVPWSSKLVSMFWSCKHVCVQCLRWDFVLFTKDSWLIFCTCGSYCFSQLFARGLHGPMRREWEWHLSLVGWVTGPFLFLAVNSFAGGRLPQGEEVPNHQEPVVNVQWGHTVNLHGKPLPCWGCLSRQLSLVYSSWHDVMHSISYP